MAKISTEKGMGIIHWIDRKKDTEKEDPTDRKMKV